MTLIEILDIGLEKMKLNNLSKNTIRAYTHAIKTVRPSPIVIKSLSDISYDDMEKLKNMGSSDSASKTIEKAMKKVFYLSDTIYPSKLEKPLEDTLKDALDEYLSFLNKIIDGSFIGLSVQTAKAYQYQLNKFIRSDEYLSYQYLPACELPKHILESYMTLNARGKSVHNQTINMLRMMENICGGKVPAFHQIEFKQEPTYIEEYQYLSIREINEILERPITSDYKTARANALLSVVIIALATTDDIQSLLFNDVCPNQITLRYRGFDYGRLNFPTSYYKHVLNWVKIARNEHPLINEKTPLFFNPQYILKPLSRYSIWHIIQSSLNDNVVRKVSIDTRTGVGIHCLRVSSARMLYAQAYDIDTLACMSGINDFDSFIKTTDSLKEMRQNNLQKNQLYQSMSK